ncbi:spore cortex-lytic enzyme [Desmospora profundinema]|uniref:Spore cortex-lytic enzyme n=1 Tax=Desmospora profundinema TaxID=1571184 RepID=A0ABU1IUE6_9BACL|nr:spore cortex-lytic enzyme [Desmospora profundinema]MDR6227380.1 N-acetylmuramoyl-L-alanine amidase [Desmospora profundinema]
MKSILTIGLAVAIAVAGTVLPFGANQAEASAPTLVHYGHSNGDVWDLQDRLTLLGYTPKVDGIYGLQTERAVIQFQKDNALRIDGITGPETWTALKKATDDKRQAKKAQSFKRIDLSQEDLEWIAKGVYSEARGEPYKGQVAVAAVIINRMESSDYPSTAKEVILEPRAFTAVADGQIWLKPNEKAYKAARDAANGWDPSQGAMFYFNPDTATSKWIWTRPQIDKIGSHIFAK